MLEGVKIAVYVSGGIAAYKIPDFVRALIKAGAQVRVAMTPAAEKFTTAYTFEVLSKYPVLKEKGAYPDPVGHINLADWLDLAILVPATANSLAKLVHGVADNEALASLLACNQPCLIVPAMNNKMWQHPATQRNVQQLRQDGYYVLEPATGFLAEGYEGKGRMPEVDQILQAVFALAALSQHSEKLKLHGKNVLISAGGTQEAIDPVRYISNHSSGKMGLAIAHVACLAGAQVTLVRTPSARNLPLVPEIQLIDVADARDLQQAMESQIEQADIVVMAAAVSDYRPAEVADQKIKKAKDQDASDWHLHFIENPDILAGLPKNRAVVVGFAAETQNVEKNATAKLVRKGADMIVANDVSRSDIGFGTDQNAVTLVTHQEKICLAKSSKFQIAWAILDLAQKIKKA